MQSLTSVWRRRWSGRIASLARVATVFFSFLFFAFFAKPTGRTVRAIWTNEGS